MPTQMVKFLPVV